MKIQTLVRRYFIVSVVGASILCGPVAYAQGVLPSRVILQRGDIFDHSNSSEPIDISGISQEFDFPTIANSGDVVAGVGLMSPVWDPTTQDPNRKALINIAPDGTLSKLYRPLDPAPGTPAGVTFDAFGIPRDRQINRAGQVVFMARLAGVPATLGVWRFSNGVTTLALREGQSAPGTPQGTYFGIGNIFSNGYFSKGMPMPYYRSDGAFYPRVALGNNEPGAGGLNIYNSNATYTFDESGLSLALRTGDEAPGAGGSVFAPYSNPYPFAYEQFASPTGELLIGSNLRLNGAEVLGGYWMRDQNGTQPIARYNDHAPGTPADINFSGFLSRAIGDNGNAAFIAQMVGPGLTALNNTGIFARRNGALVLVGRAGTPYPGFPAGQMLRAPINGNTEPTNTTSKNLFVANNGDIVARYNIEGVPSTGRTAIVREHQGAFEIIARKGMEAPGTPANTFTDISGQHVFGDFLVVGHTGRVALIAKLAGTGVSSLNDYGLWGDGPGALMLIAREGMNIGDGSYRVGQLGNSSSPNLASTHLQINAAGQVVFFATLIQNGDQYNIQHEAVLATTPSGTLKVVAIDGVANPLLEGGSMYASHPRIGNGTDLNPSITLNDNSEAIFVTDITGGGSAVLLATVADSAPQCRADFNHDGAATVQDLFDFLNSFFSQNTNADFNGSGTVTTQDLFDFLGAWFEGC